MKRYRVLLIGVLMIAVLGLAGCSQAAQPSEPAGSTQPADSGAKPADLAGTRWDCYEFKVSGAPQMPLAEAPITAEFSADGKLSGSSGVNTYSTTYKTEGNGITIDKQIVSTKMAGSDDAMKQESNYLLVLPTAVTYEVDSKGDLILFGAADETLARYHAGQ